MTQEALRGAALPEQGVGVARGLRTSRGVLCLGAGREPAWRLEPFAHQPWHERLRHLDEGHREVKVRAVRQPERGGVQQT